MRKTIAVDFDGCLCEAKWPDIGPARQFVINELLKQQAEGAKIILWTCREGEQLQAAVMWCLNHGIKFDAINDNLEENKEHFGNNSRKVWANEYWDDKSVLILGDKTGYCSISSAACGIPSVKVESYAVIDRHENPYGCKPGEIAVIPTKVRAKRPKRWWQIWRCD